MVKPATIFSGEIADRLGYSADYFRRHIDRLIIEKCMPTPLPALGRKRWDRARIEAWLAGQRVPQPANDAAPLAPNDDDWRAALNNEYGRAG